jgi:hypothetical protein
VHSDGEKRREEKRGEERRGEERRGEERREEVPRQCPLVLLVEVMHMIRIFYDF